MPLNSEKAEARELIPTTTRAQSRVFSVEGRGKDMMGAAQQLDLEGIVAKRKADPYDLTTTWYKIKDRAYTQTEDRWELFNRPE